MKVAIHTLGCKVNSYESSAVLAMFKDANYEVVDFNSFSDVYIINTCSVTNQSDAKSRKYIRQAIRKNPEAIVVVMGCYAQTNKEEIKRILGVSIVIGNHEKNNVLNLVNEFISKRNPIDKVIDISKVKDFENLEATEFERTRAFLKIQDGCNNFCSYCIIPYARGRMRSRPKADVLKQALMITEKGYKEIVLTGIHTGGYGVDINYAFSSLVKDILNNTPKLERLRISSIEMNQIDDEILRLLKEEPRLCNHIHLPIQSGSNNVLKMMNRHYDIDRYMDVVNKLREANPDISITTDIIIGYPTESEEDFNETLENVKKINFSFMHIFPFSKRSGTVAARYEELNGNIMNERLKKISKINQEMAKSFADKFINRELDFIPESYHDGNLIGHTSNFLKVIVKGNEELIGQKISIIIKKTGFPENYGEII